jgi:parvulin-like peptidyl-prolyl isomerase
MAASLVFPPGSAPALAADRQAQSPAAGESPGTFLPDSAILARVGDRVVRVRDFVVGYFSTPGTVRPPADSAGRVEYLQTLIKKEILGQTARAINPPLTFEDRAIMRETRERALANVLYQRSVLDSVSVTDDDVLKEYENYKSALRVQHILFDDRETAERVRLLLQSGRISWKKAVKDYSRPMPEEGPDGEVGWIERRAMTNQLAQWLYGLKIGGVSQVVQDREGFHILRVIDRRAVSPPAFTAIKRLLRSELHSTRAAERALRLRTRLAIETGIRYDSVNVSFAAPRFPVENVMQNDAQGPILDLNANTAPTFEAADRARVLARWDDKTLTLGQFVDAYSNLPALARPSVGTFAAMCEQINLFVLEPVFAKLAEERGFDRDPLTTQMIEQRREQIFVERIYQDSVMALVQVTPQDRRDYYSSHLDDFVSTPQIRFCVLVRRDANEARSLLRQLEGGADAESLVHADSMRGVSGSSIQQRYKHEKGPLHAVLFDEMKLGDVRMIGPDRDGDYLILKILDRNEGRQIPFEEIAAFIDESLQNSRAESLLNALIERNRARYPGEVHPELVMRIDLVDPVLRQ